MSRLAGKTAIVTGAGARSEQGVGTGHATAVLFAREGARVLLVDNDVAAAERTLVEIEAEGGTASVFKGMLPASQTADYCSRPPSTDLADSMC